VQFPISIIGVPVAGWIYDSTGSYALAFQLFIGFYVAASLLIGALRLGPVRPTAPQPSAADERK
jgi:nitrate/nitrite transporter NarK